MVLEEVIVNLTEETFVKFFGGGVVYLFRIL